MGKITMTKLTTETIFASAFVLGKVASLLDRGLIDTADGGISDFSPEIQVEMHEAAKRLRRELGERHANLDHALKMLTAQEK